MKAIPLFLRTTDDVDLESWHRQAQTGQTRDSEQPARCGTEKATGRHAQLAEENVSRAETEDDGGEGTGRGGVSVTLVACGEGQCNRAAMRRPRLHLEGAGIAMMAVHVSER